MTTLTKMKYKNLGEKTLTHDDMKWIMDNTSFYSSEIDTDTLYCGDDFHCNSKEQDRSKDKRFLKEFKKWFVRWERINRDVEFHWSTPDDRQFIVDDKMRIVFIINIEFFTYIKKVSLSTFMKCIEFVCENSLDEVHSRVLVSHIIQNMDFKDKRTNEIILRIADKFNSNYSEIAEEVSEKLYILKTMCLEKNTYEDKKKYINKENEDLENKLLNKKYVIAYRGLFVTNDERVTDNDGMSFTLDYKTAFIFSMAIKNNLICTGHIDVNDKRRSLVAQYIIPVDKIISYSNARFEQEIIVDPKHIELHHYDFTTSQFNVPNVRMSFRQDENIDCYELGNNFADHIPTDFSKFKKLSKNKNDLEVHYDEVA